MSKFNIIFICFAIFLNFIAVIVSRLAGNIELAIFHLLIGYILFDINKERIREYFNKGD